MPEQSRLYFDAGKTVAIGRKSGNFLVAQSRANRQALKRPALIKQLAESTPILGLNFYQFAEILDHCIEILDFGRRDFESERRVVPVSYTHLDVYKRQILG